MDEGEALRLAEAEAYRRIGGTRPETYECYYIYMRSVQRGREVLDKRVEVAAGPCSSQKELQDRYYQLAPDVKEVSKDMNAKSAWLKANWPDGTGLLERTCAIKAADREHALRAEGIRVHLKGS